MKCVALTAPTAAACILLISAATAAPTAKKMDDKKLDTVVAGWVNPGNQPCGSSQWDCGNNGWGNGFDLNNPGSYQGGTAPSKTCNCSEGSDRINTNPTTSDGR